MRMRSTQRTSSVSLGLAAALITAVSARVLYLVLGRPGIGIDDANIFMVYARNLVQGHGLAFNIAGERVEGFTSLLWVLLLSPAYAIADIPENLVILVSCLLTAASVYCLYVSSLADESDESRLSWNIMVVVLSLAWNYSNTSWVLWNVLSQMENCLYLFTIGLCYRGLAKFSKGGRTDVGWSSKIGLITLVLTRPEGMALALLFVLCFLLAAYAKVHSLRSASADVMVLGQLYAATMVFFFAFRWSYFGYPLPNTYYAKVSPDFLNRVIEGYEYFVSFLASGIHILLCFVTTFLAGIVSAGKLCKQWLRKEGFDYNYLICLFNFLLVLALAAMPMYSGGDHMYGFRFYSSLFPLLLLTPLLLLKGLVWPAIKHHPALRPLLAISLALVFIFSPVDRWSLADNDHRRLESDFGFAVAVDGRYEGRVMNELFQGVRRPVVGDIAVGGIQYTYQGSIYDLLGLNCLAMAHHDGERYGWKNHRAFNKGVFYQAQPDIILPSLKEKVSPKPYAPNDFKNTTLKGIFAEPEFTRLYQVAMISRKEWDQGPWLFGLFLRDYLAVLADSGLFDVMQKPLIAEGEPRKRNW